MRTGCDILYTNYHFWQCAGNFKCAGRKNNLRSSIEYPPWKLALNYARVNENSMGYTLYFLSINALGLMIRLLSYCQAKLRKGCFSQSFLCDHDVRLPPGRHAKSPRAAPTRLLVILSVGKYQMNNFSILDFPCEYRYHPIFVFDLFNLKAGF